MKHSGNNRPDHLLRSSEEELLDGSLGALIVFWVVLFALSALGWGLPVAEGKLAVAGKLMTEMEAPVEGAMVYIRGGVVEESVTPGDGTYYFSDLHQGMGYTVEPWLDEYHANGVTTADLIAIRKHILGVAPLDSPYKLLAADVTLSGGVSTMDLIQIRKLILAIDKEFEKVESWEFIPEGYVFPDPERPWEAMYPRTVSISSLEDSEMHANFVAIKMGDVNGTARPSNPNAAPPSFRHELAFNIENKALYPGEIYELSFDPISARVEAFQFTLQYMKNAVEVEEILYGQLGSEHLATFPEEGMITTSWDKYSARAEGGLLFGLRIKALKNIQLKDALEINSRLTPAEAYLEDQQAVGLGLQFEETSAAASPEFLLLQNHPNPFRQRTLIGFNLPEADWAELQVYDTNGRLVMSKRNYYERGFHTIQIDRAELGHPNWYYYRLKTKNQTAARKMLLHE